MSHITQLPTLIRSFDSLRTAGGFLGFAPRVATDQPLQTHTVYAQGRLLELGALAPPVVRRGAMRFANDAPTPPPPDNAVSIPAPVDNSAFATILSLVRCADVSTPEAESLVLEEIEQLLIDNATDGSEECLELARIVLTLPISLFRMHVLNSLLSNVDTECKREFYDFFMANWQMLACYHFLMEQIDYFNTEEITRLGNVCLDDVGAMLASHQINNNILMMACNLLGRLYYTAKDEECRAIMQSWQNRPVYTISRSDAAKLDQRAVVMLVKGSFLKII